MFFYSLRTTLCVRFKSEVVACGVVYAAARRNLVALPENPPWWEAFDAQKPDIDEVCRVLANLYQQPRPRYIEVGKDSRPFVLTSRAWDPPPSDVQASTLHPQNLVFVVVSIICIFDFPLFFSPFKFLVLAPSSCEVVL